MALLQGRSPSPLVIRPSGYLNSTATSSYLAPLPADRVRTCMPGISPLAMAPCASRRGLQQQPHCAGSPPPGSRSLRAGMPEVPRRGYADNFCSNAASALHQGPSLHEPTYYSSHYDFPRRSLELHGGRVVDDPLLAAPHGLYTARSHSKTLAPTAGEVKAAFGDFAREPHGARGGTAGQLFQDIALRPGLPREGYVDIIGQSSGYEPPRGGSEGELLRALHSPFRLPTGKLFDRDPYGTGARSEVALEEELAAQRQQRLRDVTGRLTGAHPADPYTLSNGARVGDLLRRDPLPLLGPRGCNAFFDPYSFNGGTDSLRYRAALAQHGRYGEAFF